MGLRSAGEDRRWNRRRLPPSSTQGRRSKIARQAARLQAQPARTRDAPARCRPASCALRSRGAICAVSPWCANGSTHPARTAAAPSAACSGTLVGPLSPPWPAPAGAGAKFAARHLRTGLLCFPSRAPVGAQARSGHRPATRPRATGYRESSPGAGRPCHAPRMPVRDGVAPAGINSKPKRLTVTAPTPIGSGRFGSVKCRIPRSRAGWRHLPDSPPEALGAKLRRNRRTEDAPVSVVWSAAADRGACPSEPPPGPCRPPVRGRCRALPGGWP